MKAIWLIGDRTSIHRLLFTLSSPSKYLRCTLLFQMLWTEWKITVQKLLSIFRDIKQFSIPEEREKMKTTLTTILSKLVNIKCDVKRKTMKVMSAVDLQVTLSYASAKTPWHFLQFNMNNSAINWISFSVVCFSLTWIFHHRYSRDKETIHSR